MRFGNSLILYSNIERGGKIQLYFQHCVQISLTEAGSEPRQQRPLGFALCTLITHTPRWPTAAPCNSRSYCGLRFAIWQQAPTKYKVAWLQLNESHHTQWSMVDTRSRANFLLLLLLLLLLALSAVALKTLSRGFCI